MKFTIDISDKGQLAAIADARTAFNENNPQAPLATDDEFFQRDMLEAAKAYARQYGYDAESLDAMKAEVAAREAKMAAAKK